ncbi:MAG: hypothetical protein K8S54_09785 [Spirochaetia bacterium]|nr:hypothetical protein [Spirochaetia bacterium]
MRTITNKTTVLIATVALAAGFTLGTLNAENQPNMVAALGHLNAALTSLKKATADKGGHRVKAIQLTNDAIAAVKAGIAADNAK